MVATFFECSTGNNDHLPIGFVGSNESAELKSSTVSRRLRLCSPLQTGSFLHSMNQLGMIYDWSPDVNIRSVIEVIPRQSRLLTVEEISSGFTS
jgi:hypothetical protein